MQTTLKETPPLSNMTSDYQRSVTDNDPSDDDSTEHSRKSIINDNANCDNTEAKSKQKKSDNPSTEWTPTTKWVTNWKQKLPLQTIMRLLQVLVPQVEKLCIERSAWICKYSFRKCSFQRSHRWIRNIKFSPEGYFSWIVACSSSDSHSEISGQHGNEHVV